MMCFITNNYVSRGSFCFTVCDRMSLFPEYCLEASYSSEYNPQSPASRQGIIRKYEFWQRTVYEWNKFVVECVNATSVNM